MGHIFNSALRILVLFPLYTVISCSPLTSVKEGISVSKGLFETPRNSIVYTDSAPIHFVVPVPNFDNQDVLNRVQQITLESCNDTDHEYCHFHQGWAKYLRDTASELMELQSDASSRLKRLKKRYVPVVGDVVSGLLNACCGIISDREMNAFIVNQKSMAEVLASVQGIVTHDHEQFQNLSAAVNAQTKDYAIRLNKLHGEIAQLEKKAGNRYDHLLDMNMINLRLFTVNMHVRKLSTVINSCKIGLLSDLIVDPSKLNLILGNLSETLSEKDMKLAIPETDILLYYAEKLVMCGLNEDKNLDIILKVPLVSKYSSWSISEIKPVPYRYKNSVCQLLPSPVYHFMSGNNSIFRTKDSIPVPADGQLFFLPRTRGSDASVSQCCQAMANDMNIDDVKALCPFECTAVDTTRITEVDTGVFAITSYQSQMEVKCDNDTTFIDIPSVGTLIIRLPCECSVALNGTIVIDRNYPCDNRIHISGISGVQQIPAMWTSFRNLTISSATGYHFLNHSNIYNESWTPAEGVSFKVQKIERTLPKLLLNYDSTHNWFWYVASPAVVGVVGVLIIVALFIAYQVWKLTIRVEILQRDFRAKFV